MPTFRPPGGMQRQERLHLVPGQADPRRGPHARASPRTAPATGGCHTTEQSAPAAGGAVWPWRAQGDQDAGGVEDQSAALSHRPGSLGYPASRIAPQAGAALGDGQVEAARGQRDVCGVSLDEREGDAEPVLTVPGGLELGRVTSTRVGRAPRRANHAEKCAVRSRARPHLGRGHHQARRAAPRAR